MFCRFAGVHSKCVCADNDDNSLYKHWLVGKQCVAICWHIDRLLKTYTNIKSCRRLAVSVGQRHTKADFSSLAAYTAMAKPKRDWSMTECLFRHQHFAP